MYVKFLQRLVCLSASLTPLNRLLMVMICSKNNDSTLPMNVVNKLFSPNASTKISQAVVPEGPDIE